MNIVVDVVHLFISKLMSTYIHVQVKIHMRQGLGLGYAYLFPLPLMLCDGRRPTNSSSHTETKHRFKVSSDRLKKLRSGSYA